MVMKELTFKRTCIISISLVVMFLMITSVASAGTLKTPMEKIIYDGNSISGTFNQIDTDYSQAETYGMDIVFSNVDKNAHTFDGVVTYTEASGESFSADLSGSYDNKANKMNWKTTDEVSSSSDTSPLIGVRNSATLNTGTNKLSGSSKYKGETIGTFSLS
jgi:hypothetical protein